LIRYAHAEENFLCSEADLEFICELVTRAESKKLLCDVIVKAEKLDRINRELTNLRINNSHLDIKCIIENINSDLAFS
jgi:hypothetical protein